MATFFLYIDAGSGSLLIQLLAGGAAGFVAFFKYRWGGFRRRRRTSPLVPEPAIGGNLPPDRSDGEPLHTPGLKS